MLDLSKVLVKVVKKKNLGYTLHRVNKNKVYFTEALPISELDVIIAKNILEIISIKTKEDLLLGLSCVVVLSANEKRKRLLSKINKDEQNQAISQDKLYYYKAKVNVMLAEAIKKDLDFTFDIKKDAKDIEVTYISLSGVQFSFHNTNTSSTLKNAKENNFRQYKDQEWDKNFSFQNGAKEIFEFALHLKKNSKLRYIKETPIEFATSLRQMAKEKGIEF